MYFARKPGDFDLDSKRYEIHSWPVDDVFSAQELIEIRHKLNSWEWDGRLGERPRGWDEMPRFTEKRKNLTSKRDKISIITPIMREIGEYIPPYYLLRYHHEVSFGSTEEEFDRWWIREGGFR